MTTIYHTIYGSHLYGTAVPSSDKDYFEIYVPHPNKILLKKDGTGSNMVKTPEFEKTIHPISFIMDGLRVGNATSLEVLFSTQCNPDFYVWTQWQKLYNGWERLVSKNCESLVGYCRAQAHKYDNRGEKLEALTKFKEILEKHDGFYRLVEIELEFLQFKQIGIPQNNGADIMHFDLFGTKIPLTFTVKEALGIVNRRLAEYGKRTREAANNANVDWKGMAHAVRLSEQTIEYLQTGRFTFPRVNAEFILDIRLGNIPYKYVCEIINQNLLEIEELKENTLLPEKIDATFLDNWILETYEMEKKNV